MLQAFVDRDAEEHETMMLLYNAAFRCSILNGVAFQCKCNLIRFRSK